MEQQPLTAQDVQSVTFGTTRVRVGYNMDEVDAFLDRVEHSIAHLSKALAHAQDHEIIQRAELQRLRERMVGSAPDEPVTAGHDPIVREIRERLRRVLTDQLTLLDQFAEDEMSLLPEDPPPASHP